MVRGLKLLAAVSALSLALPGAAHAASALDCMAQSYDDGQRARIAEISADFSLAEKDGHSSSEDLAGLAFEVAGGCMVAQDWPEDAFYYAVLYEVSRLSEAAYRQSGRLDAESVRKLDEALAKRERPELWAVLERAVVAGMEQREPEFTAQEEFLMGAFTMSAGLGSDGDLTERVGELMGIMAMVRYTRREFEALLEQE